MMEYFSVTVSRNGERLVTIETTVLSGRELSDEDEDCIRNAARHLLGFVGNKINDDDESFPPPLIT
jgi:hypothetical protein